MEITYMVRGVDGKEYGPASLAQLSGWIQEGRVLARQEIRRSDIDYWAAAGDFTELKAAFGGAPGSAMAGAGAAVATVATAPQPLGGGATLATQKDPARLASLRGSASWFFLIAVLSLVNSVAAASGSAWRFLVGLGFTQILDYFGNQMGGAGTMVALALNLLVTGAFVLFGIFARKGHTWAFLTGLILFALDSVIFIMGKDWIGVAFHAYVIYRLFCGFQSCRQLRAA